MNSPTSVYNHRGSDPVRRHFELSVEAEIRGVPVTTTFEHHDVVSLDHGHDIVVALQPVVATCMHPADVVAAVSRTALVRNHSDQLIVARIET